MRSRRAAPVRPSFVNPGQTAYAFSTASPNKAYAAALIGGASNVASALLGPRDAVIGTAILGANAPDGTGASDTYSASVTFDFADRGDLLLGLIDGSGAVYVTINDAESLETGFGAGGNSVIFLGSNWGPDIALKIVMYDGSGDFVIGKGVPEPSTWAMMLLGFAGLGYAGYRRAREPCA
jgi:PEP-CTERM motif